MTPSRGLAFAMFAASALLTGAAYAEAGEAAAAQALFDEARALMQADRAEQACPKFEESQRLDPGTGTLLNLALCYELTNRLASAWSTYLEAAAASKVAGNTERELLARERAATLEPKLAKLVIEVDPSVADFERLEVYRDGVPVGRAQWGLPVPADEGQHPVEVRRGQDVLWRKTVEVLGPKTVAQVNVPPLSTFYEGPPEASPTGWHPQRTWALVAGGVGVVGLGLSAGFGLSAQSTYDDSSSECSSSNVCSPTGLELRDSAGGKATVSTVAFSIGLAGVIGGVALWLTAPGGTPDSSEPEDEGLALGVSPGLAGGTWAATAMGSF